MEADESLSATSDRVAVQLRAAAREFLDGDRDSYSARRALAVRIYRREVERVANATLAAAWEKALADEKAARGGKGA